MDGMCSSVYLCTTKVCLVFVGKLNEGVIEPKLAPLRARVRDIMFVTAATSPIRHERLEAHGKHFS